jgi:hypothetical protein
MHFENISITGEMVSFTVFLWKKPFHSIYSEGLKFKHFVFSRSSVFQPLHQSEVWQQSRH